MIKLIDISFWQQGINYPLLSENIDGVILRAAYGVWKDTWFDRHYDSFAACKVPIGAYHYIVGNLTGVEQAEAFAASIEGRELLLGIWNDVEDTRPETALTPQVVLDYHEHAEALTEMEMGVYTSASKWDMIMRSKVLSSKKLWIANYGVLTPALPKTGGWPSWWLWQYTDRERLPGYGSSLDGNRFNGSRQQYFEWIGIEDEEPELENITYVIEMLGNLKIRESPEGMHIEGAYALKDETYYTKNMVGGWYEIEVNGVIGWISGLTRWTRITVIDGEPEEPETPFLTMQQKVNKLWEAHPELHT